MPRSRPFRFLAAFTLLLATAMAGLRAPFPTPGDGHGCSSDLDCSLNGVCDVPSGHCRCDRPWKTGVASAGREACNVLDIVPHPDSYVPAYGGARTDTAFRRDQEVTSWGGNVLRDDQGVFHLWVSRMAGSGSGLSG